MCRGCGGIELNSVQIVTSRPKNNEISSKTETNTPLQLISDLNTRDIDNKSSPLVEAAFNRCISRTKLTDKEKTVYRCDNARENVLTSYSRENSKDETLHHSKQIDLAEESVHENLNIEKLAREIV